MGNIVWIASYPKSGNTWMRAFLGNYLANSETPVDINGLHDTLLSEANSFHYQPFISAAKKTLDIDMMDLIRLRPRVHADIAQRAQGSIFVKTHNFLGEYRGCPLHNAQVTSGAIVVVRNPLDVVISMSNYFNYDIDHTIAFMADEMTGTPNEESNVPQIISSWSTHTKSWAEKKEDSVLVVRYEDMLANAQKTFRKVESFLKLKKDPKRLKRAIQFSSFEQLKRQESQTGFVEKFEHATAFFNKGQIGQWRAVLTQEQVLAIKKQHKPMMDFFKYS